MFNKLLLLSLFFLLPISVQANTSLSINQILPNPENEDDEWIEIRNNSTEVVDITNFTIDDEQGGGSKPYKISSTTKIDPESTLKFYKSQTGIILNNTKQKDQNFADQVNLLNTSGELIDQLTYSSTSTNEVISKNPSPTPSPKSAPTSSPTPTNSPSPLPAKITSVPSPMVMGILTSSSPTSPPLNTLSLKPTQISKLDNIEAASQTSSSPITQNLQSSHPTRQLVFGILSIVVGSVLLFISLLKTSQKLKISL